MRIRRNRPEEADRLFTIWRGAVLATHDFLSPAHFDEIERMVAAWLPEARLWVAVDPDDEATGFMALDGAHIDALFVAVANHRQGVGAALIAHARTLHDTLTVEVNEQNPEAVAFYERIGFRRTGRQETDRSGLPYPLLELRLEGREDALRSRD